MTTTTIGREVQERQGNAAVLWLTQAFSGLFLIIVLTIHMIAHHFIVEGGLRNYAQVLQYVTNPLVFVLELVFVIVATAHALLGVRAVVLDGGLKPSSQRIVDWILLLVGAVTMVYGIWLAYSLQQLPI